MPDYRALIRADNPSTLVDDSEANPYREIIRADRAAAQQRVRTVLETAVRDDPDIAAERQRLSATSGLPLRVIERNLEEVRVKEKARMYDLARMAQDSPILYRQLFDPTFTTTAIDDLDNLGSLEKSVGSVARYVMGADGKGGLPKDVAGAATTLGLGATVGVGKMVFDIAGTLVDLLPGGDDAAATYRGQAKRAGDAMAAYGFEGGGSTRDAIKSGLQSAGTNLALMPIGLQRQLFDTANKAAAAVAGAMAAGVGADAFNTARGKGKNEIQALNYAIPEGVFEFVFERIPASKLFGDLAANSGLIKTLGKQVVSEGWTEQVTTLAQDFNEWMNLNPNKTLAEFVAERPEAAYQTFIATLVGAGVQTSAIHGINKIIEKVSDQTLTYELDQFEQQMKLAGASLLRQRSPEQFRAHVERLVAEKDDARKEVYVDGAVLNQLPQELLSQLSDAVREAIPAAVAAEGTVAIPMADVLTVAPGTPLEQVLNDNARMTPESMTRLESAEAGERAQEMIKTQSENVLRQAADQETWQTGMTAVKDTVLQQLNAAKRWSPEVNEAYATLQMHFFSTMAARMGTTPEALYQRFALKVAAAQGGQPAGDSKEGVFLNVGLKVPDDQGGGAVDVAAVDAALARIGVKVERGAQAQSDTEMTYIPKLSRPLTADELDALAIELKQEAIPQLVNGVGDMRGPKAAAWGPFDPKLFYLPNGNTLNQLVGTRVPVGATARDNPLSERLMVGLEPVKGDPKLLEKLAVSMDGLSSLRTSRFKDPAKRLEAYIEQMTDNLLWLHDQVPEEIRQRSKLWYVGARAIVDRWTAKFDGKYTDAQMAGVMAAMSPQMDWFQNVTLAERIIDIWTAQQDFMWTPEMSAALLKTEGASAVPELEGKTLAQVEDSLLQAKWIAAYDLAYNPRAFRVVTPEGDFADFSRNTKKKNEAQGKPMRASWANGFGPVAKAVRILQDGSIDNISDQLGRKHKVRSFYNNIFDPMEPNGSVTVDTHAVAAALLLPLSGSTPEVLRNFGTPDSAPIGSYGTYPIYDEAYRRAAAKRGLLPREMQSITWEAVRGLYDASTKVKYTKDRAAFDAVWKALRKEEITHEQARQKLIELADGISDPEWVRPSGAAPQENWSASYAGELLDGSGAQGTVGRGTGVDAAGGTDAAPGPLEQRDRLEPLPGVPNVRGGGPIQELVAVAEAYAAANGIELKRQGEYVQVDPERGKRIADLYDSLPHTPDDPRVRASYEALAQQTLAQYQALVAAGYSFTFYDSKSDPYKKNPFDAMRDLRATKSMAVYGTYDGYGNDLTGAKEDTTLLRFSTGMQWPDQAGVMHDVTYNDLFRAVHDAFGHGLEGAGFRGRGEENAWQAHIRLYTPEAHMALTNETRAQNSWLNYGPYGEKNRTASVDETVFADQKNVVLPEWVWMEGRAPDMGEQQDMFPEELANESTTVDTGVVVDSRGGTQRGGNVNSDGQKITATVQGLQNFWNWFGQSEATDDSGHPLVLYHSTRADTDVLTPGQPTRNNYGFLGDVDTSRAAVFATPDRDFSQEYLRNGAGQNVMPIYMRLLKPFDTRKGISEAQEKELIDAGVSSRWLYDYRQHDWEMYDNDDEGKNFFVDTLKALGYDGAIFNEEGQDGKTHTTYAVFDSAQIKSATGNRGTFDPESPNVLRQPARGTFDPSNLLVTLNETANLSTFLHESGHFFLEVMADLANDPKAPQQIKDDMDAVLKWFGITGTEDVGQGSNEGSLNQSPWYSALQRAIESSPTKAAPAQGWKDAVKGWVAKGLVKQDEVDAVGLIEYLDALPGKITREQVFAFIEQNGVQVEETVLGGGESTTDWFVDESEVGDGWSVYNADAQPVGGEFQTRAEAEAALATWSEKPGTKFDSPNWRPPGGDPATYREMLFTLPQRGDAAARAKRLSEIADEMADTTPERYVELHAERAALIEDYLGDYRANQGGGFRSSHWDQPNVLAHTRLIDSTDADGNRVLNVIEIQSDWGQKGRDEGFQADIDINPTDAEVVEYFGLKEGADPADYRQEMIDREKRIARNKGVPSAPFVTKTDAWVALVLKRVVKLAVDEGYDKVAISTGQEAADMFDLSKQVDRVYITKLKNGGFEYSVTKDGRDVASRLTVPDAKGLADVVGKELASKADQQELDSGKAYEGLDLKVGGEGMKVFYDKIVPSVLKDVLKKVGGKVETVVTKKGEVMDHTSRTGYRKLWNPGRIGFTITDEMRAKVEGGMPLFQGAEGQAPAPMAPKGRTPLETWNLMTLDEKRPYHEKFAESFEAYLMTGKAPNAELQSLFRTFRSWLLNVYKSLKAFMVGRQAEIGKDITQVFDRMLATDEQVREAEGTAGLLPDFDATNEAMEKLTARSMRDLKWAVNARNKMIAKLQKQASALRKGIETQVRAEVESQPVYRAIRWLKKGETTDPETGDLVKAEKGFRLNTAALAEMYPESMLSRPDLDGLKGMTAATGLHPDMVADMFGYPSGDALVRAVIGAEPIGSVIEGMTDQRMLEQHGDLVDQRAIEEAANEAVHNEARAKSLATELKAQSEMLNPRVDSGRTNAKGKPITVNGITEAAKQFAMNLVARRQIKALKNAAWQHRAAEARASKAWQEATAKGDTAAAVEAKRNQVLNHFAAKAAMDAQAEVRKTIEFFRKITKGSNEKIVKGGRDPDVVNAMRAILAAYGVTPRVGKAATEYMDTVAQNDPAMHAALRPSVDAALANAMPLDEMTVEELRGLTAELEGMWELAKRSRQMEVDGNLMDLEDAGDQLVARMDEVGIPARIPGEGSAVTDAEEKTIKVKFAKAFLSRVEQWAERMDGKFGGPFLRLVTQPIKEAADRYRTARVEYRKKFTALVQNLAPSLPPGKIEAPELGYVFGAAHNDGAAELTHALLHTGNESNKRKLLLGRGWATETDGVMDTSKWDTFLQRMYDEGKLTKAHWDFAQGVWDLLEETKPLAQATHRQVFGRYFAEVTADPVVTPFGTYRGGYVPALTDSRIVKDAKLRTLAEGENESMAYAFPASPSGFTKARVDYNRPLMLDLRTLGQHVDKVLLFSHMQGPVTDVRRLLTRKGVSYALDRVDPSAFEGMLIPWLNRAAKQIVETPTVGDRGVSRLLSAARSRAGMALMFANLSNTAQQITGFSLATVKVRPGLLLSSTSAFVRDPKAMKAAVTSASEFMRNRMENEVAALNDVVEEILVNPTALELSQDWTRRHAYFLQAAVDNAMSPIVWTAAYNQAVEEKMSERDAIRFADGVVRQTQGSTLPEDISRFESGPAAARMFTQFVSYFNMMANTTGTAVKQIMDEVGLRRGAGRVMYVALAGVLAPIWVAEAIAQAFRGGPEDEEGDGWLDDWLMAVFGLGTIRGLAATVPFVGQAAQLVVNRFNDNPADDKFSLSPAVSLIESTVSAPHSVYKAIIEEGSAQKAVKDTAAMLTMATGLPIYALARPLSYAAGVAQGKIDPTGAADAVRGALTGVASPESKVR